MLSITPVLDVSSLPRGQAWPWPVASAAGHSAHLPLEVGSLETMGTFFALLAAPAAEGTVPADFEGALALLRARDSFVAPGGLLLREMGVLIQPGSCCGLESWPEWEDFLARGLSPWMGHDPGPYAELREGKVSLWADMEQAATAIRGPSITIPRADFEAALRPALSRIQAFLGSLPGWFQAMERPAEEELLARIWRDFSYRPTG